MIEANIIKLEDNLDYVVIATKEILDNKYIIMCGEEDPNNIVVRKVINKDEHEILIKLDSKEELEKVLLEYMKDKEKDNDTK